MEYLKKAILKLISQKSEPYSLYRIEEHLLKQINIPSFNQEILYDVIKSMQGVEIQGLQKKTKKDKEQDKQKEDILSVKVKLSKQENYRINKIDRIRFEDVETIQVLEMLYDFIISAGREGISYIQLQQLLQKTNNKKFKLQINQISHYCRKLYNFGFIDIIMRQHFKIAIARKCIKARDPKKIFDNQEKKEEDVYIKKYSIKQMNKKQVKKMSICQNETGLSQFRNVDVDANESINDQAITNISSLTEYQNRNCFYFRELQFFQNLHLNLASNECFLKEGLTLQEIQSRINKVEEKKSLSRLFEILWKEGELNQFAERQGKIFSYRYRMKQQLTKRIKSEENIKQVFDLQDNDIDMMSVQNLIKIDSNAFTDLVQCVKQKQLDFDYDNITADKILRYLNDLSVENQSRGQRRKTQPSRQKFNRFTTIINILHEKKVTKQIEIKTKVILLESDTSIGNIDGRTIQGIFSVLQRIGYCYTLKEKVVIASKECDRILFIHHSIHPDDPIVKDGLQDLKNISLGNQFKKQIRSKDRDNDSVSYTSTPQKKVKIQNSKLSKSLQIKIQDSMNLRYNEQDDIYHSDESQQQPKLLQEKNDHLRISRDKRNALALPVVLSTILEKNIKSQLQISFKQLLPCYQVVAANLILNREQEETSMIQLCDSVEQMLRKKVRPNQNKIVEPEPLKWRKWDDIEEETRDRVNAWESHTLKYSSLAQKTIQNLPADNVASERNHQYDKQQVYQAFKYAKHSLLSHPYINLSTFVTRYPVVDLDVFINKCQMDETIKLSYLDYDLSQETIFNMVSNRECLDKIYLMVQHDFLAYFI